ncbi:carboxylesterase family domain-containing protein [Phthorimaea operculella]|nr:carboxylesterase family domain-containing protein [Phthorimaea operculella]
MKLFLLLITLALVSCKDLDDVDFDDEDEKQPPIVKIEQGTIRGGWEESMNGRQFALFERIPYAKPPVGELRFKAPLPVEPWSGIFNATGAQENCLQYEPFFSSVSGSEDCLLINVYTPRANSWANMPVMVFIHGGAYFYGAGFYYDPVRIMDWDIVVVTFNYRIGPLGFLSTGDDVIPGNAGLKDQVMALRWIQNNIRAFGGDPDSVTLTGHSAGAASVHYHYLSPLSKGLFARGIAFSGSALSPWAFATRPVKRAKDLAVAVGCPAVDTSKDISECLMNKSAVDIVNATSWMFGEKFWFSPFVPTAEPEGMEGAFITKHPYSIAKAGVVNDVPLLITTVADEGLYPSAAYYANPNKSLPLLEETWQKQVPRLFQLEENLPEDRWAEVAAKIKEQYFGEEPVSKETFPKLVQAVGERLFISSIGRMAELQAASSKKPVHMYRYTFKGDTRFHMAMTWNDKINLGVGHGDDLFHIFYMPLITPATERDDESKVNDLMTALVYNYCKTGVPMLPKEAPDWTPLTPGQPALNFMEISSPRDFQMKTSTDLGNRAFWDSLGLNENQNYRNNLS